MASASSSNEDLIDHNEISKVVIQHFNSLPKKGKPLVNEWTTLAAIVQSRKEIHQKQTLKTVALATGTKCIGQNELSLHGDLVHDMHAEVLARRSFLVYLYEQINLLSSQRSIGHDDSILDCGASCTSEADINNTSVKEDVRFHLFISQLPCGDASIISEEADVVEGDEPERKRHRIDVDSAPIQSRTGAKLQAGKLIYEEVQTLKKCRVKPGKGDPTLCMSCSDKIAKWQLLGLQGSLLGIVIREPIRFSSITIGSSVPFSLASLNRALHERFESTISDLRIKDQDFNDVLKNYQQPSVGQAISNFESFVDSNCRPNPSPSSIIWNAGLQESQVIVNGRRQGATKKNYGKASSMVCVCRKSLFDLFKSTCLSNLLLEKEKIEKTTYAEAKALNEVYQRIWNKLKLGAFEGWTTKPSNIQDFC